MDTKNVKKTKRTNTAKVAAKSSAFNVNLSKLKIKSMDDYEAIHQKALEDPAKFWGERAKSLLHWFKPWEKTLEWDFAKPHVEWFTGGKTNASYNCLDRHIDGPRRNKVALIWQGDPEDDVRIWTYQMLYDRVCRFASALKNLGVRKGDRVVIYLPMIPEMVVSMLACSRIGAVHVLVFAGFSASSAQSRIQDCEAKVVITSDGMFRAGRVMPLKANIDEALKDCPSVRRVIVVNRTNMPTAMKERRDIWWRDVMSDRSLNARLPAVQMDAEDLLFILYTSGSTGKPKGVMHTTGGYLTYAAHTTQLVFDTREEDVHWCTADIGWITGHTYGVYGPLLLGGTTMMFEGGPRWPDPDRFWHIIEKYRVNTFYTAPTAIRLLIRDGDEWLEKHDRSSLRILGSVGEPIDAKTWNWYRDTVGDGKIPVVDTWWQTESGGILVSPIPYVTPLKPGSASLPLPGIDVEVLKEDGKPAKVDEEGHLVVKNPWPGMLRGVFGDKSKFKENYFSRFSGFYLSGDGVKKDQDGYLWLQGRLDDVINVSGHRFSTAEMEAAFNAHPAVAESSVVGMPHSVKGEAIYAFIHLKEEEKPTDAMRSDLRKWVRKEIGPIATPEYIQFVESLPKTRSGKIMRRVLRKIVSGNIEDLGDLTTLVDVSVVEALVTEHELLTGRSSLS
ncbi:acetate--CoA ligase [Desulfovibrio litoralis]|uniref:Acetate--CoA ligase n=1 Tax=Desulfovibrio litoralis DSM 11393 TaxID=1121455 RepID=A0A1M7T8J4_9BACT|nr:acetate--CoA ligase [Desulfovibrio litoralis]SHN67021.1 acetyl-coenzyme A synthetase [Desulfovibrio litoralis DSM 11393]